ncbi:TPA: hypothetical protein ACX6QL_002004, partial [Photobacterium damselae]
MASNRSKVTGFRGGRDPAALQENMELLTGQRGNGLDRAITARELAQLGLISVTRNTQGSVITTPILPTLPENKPIERPHAPVGFAGFGGFGAIMLEWQNPNFYGFAHAEIWRAVPNADGPAPNIDQAVLIATTPATVFGDVVEPGSAFYYWCRFINTKNIPGPYQGVDGIRVSTSSSIENIIDEIGTQMKDSELIKNLLGDISQKDEALELAKIELQKIDTELSDAIAFTKNELEQVDTTLNKAINNAKKELENADKLLADEVAKASAKIDTESIQGQANIKELQQVIATADNVLAQQIAQVNAAFKAAGESSSQTMNAKIS